MKEKTIARERIERILKGDKSELPIRLEDVLKSELYGLLFGYFDIRREDINLSLVLNNAGKYEVRIEILANSIKAFYQI